MSHAKNARQPLAQKIPKDEMRYPSPERSLPRCAHPDCRIFPKLDCGAKVAILATFAQQLRG